MTLTDYGFATYVFLLVCAAIWLFSRLMKRKGADASAYEKEQKLFTLYQNVEDMLSSFEEYVQEAKSDTEKSKQEIRAMLEETKRLTAELAAPTQAATDAVKKETENAGKANAQNIGSKPRGRKRSSAAVKADARDDSAAVAEVKTPKMAEFKEPAANEEKPEKKAAGTSRKVAELMDTGLNKDEIARQLGVSVREVSLAMKMRKTDGAK